MEGARIVRFGYNYPKGAPFAVRKNVEDYQDGGLRTMASIIRAGWHIWAVMENGQTVIIRPILVRDVLTGRRGLQVGRSSEGRPIIRWDDGGENSRDPETLERIR